ncbi:MAG: metallophosphoesterase [Acetobacteraceae bacterium]|nr:metallophosphoesterase [Acetobacteraceae bacterium]
MAKKPSSGAGGGHGHSRTRAGSSSTHRSSGAAAAHNENGTEGNGGEQNGSDNALHAGPNQAGGEEPHHVSGPQFAEPGATPDPAGFRVKHASDTAAYKVLDHEKPLPMGFPPPRGGAEPVLKLADIWGSNGKDVEQQTKANGQIVFHAVGDTGNTKGPRTQNEVADKMVSDFDETDPTDIPKFFLHLGDVVYSFGEAAYYYDQFYDPYRNYPAPIIALAGNHDGMVAPNTNIPTLQAFLDNFCQEEFVITPEAGGLLRTAQIQPGVFFTFEAPFVRILALYSNVLEDPGVISSDDGKYSGVPDDQLDYLRSALTRVRTEGYKGALIIAHHHPIYAATGRHGDSPQMQKQIDGICEEAGVWPHAVLSGHAHDYERFTRARGDAQVPYIVCGNGGHGLPRFTRTHPAPPRTPAKLDLPKGSDAVTLENYDGKDYGYLRIIANDRQLRIEYHPAGDGPDAKTPDDFVTVDLDSRRLVHFAG